MKFDFSKDIVLENNRVILRPLTVDVFDVLLPYSENEPELWTYSLLSGAGAENLEKYLHHALEGRKNEHTYPFLVIDKKTNEVAGSTRFYDYQALHNTTQLGFTWYGKKFQGTGLNKNCKFLLLQYAFDILNLDRVEFRADNNNARSIAAMKSIGCVPEGVLRSNCASPTGRRDSIVLSVLKTEWESAIRQKLMESI